MTLFDRDLLADPDTWPDRYHAAQTPIVEANGVFLKRDDLFMMAGVGGGKVRTCWTLASADPPCKGLVTAGSRSSPQVNIVAHIAKRLGVPCQAHTPTGKLSPELEAAKRAGAQIVQHRAGYNNVIIARAREAALLNDYREIPFGMECREAVQATSKQVENLQPWADRIKRIVVPVGSAMSLAGVLHGLDLFLPDLRVPVIGVVVGARPHDRLNRWAPPDWRRRVFLRRTTATYADEEEVWVQPDAGPPFLLDQHYEAKCWEHVEPGDLFWVVGLRQTAQQRQIAQTGSLG